jgi:hypothetical protein
MTSRCVLVWDRHVAGGDEEGTLRGATSWAYRLRSMARGCIPNYCPEEDDEEVLARGGRQTATGGWLRTSKWKMSQDERIQSRSGALCLFVGPTDLTTF